LRKILLGEKMLWRCVEMEREKKVKVTASKASVGGILIKEELVV
jgi:hypothetical protein